MTKMFSLCFFLFVFGADALLTNPVGTSNKVRVYVHVVNELRKCRRYEEPFRSLTHIYSLHC